MAHAVIEGLECTLYLDYDCQDSQVLKKLSNDGKVTWLEQRMEMIFIRPLQKIYDQNSMTHRDLHIPEGNPPMTPLFITTSAILNGIEALGSFLTMPKTKNKNKIFLILSAFFDFVRRTGTRDKTKIYRKNDKNFYTFTERYMPDWAKTVSAPYWGKTRLARILWEAFRNGLAHGFVIQHAALADLPSSSKYDESTDPIKIDGTKFFADFVVGTNKMFQDVRNDPETRKRFLTRFAELYRCQS